MKHVVGSLAVKGEIVLLFSSSKRPVNDNSQSPGLFHSPPFSLFLSTPEADCVLSPPKWQFV
ncbi:hypothetical protein PJI17_32895, partial [Mycobacterium kansasii]